MEWILAPLAEYTDVPFRLCCRSYGALRCYTPMIDAGALAHSPDAPENQRILQRDPSEPWLGVQLLGGLLRDVEVAALRLREMPFDSFDFNMGCPMQKVVKRPAGAALVFPQNQELALNCVRMLRKIWADREFTVKMRIVSEENPEETVSLARRLEECGIDGLTIHGRIQKVIYQGPVAFSVIAAVREALQIPVTANGGIFDLESGRELGEKTGCERLMVARGSIGNPWIFRELTKGVRYRPTHEELCEVLCRHIEGIRKLYGERAFPVARKIIISYLRGRGYSKCFREQSGRLASWEEFLEFWRKLREEGPLAETDALAKPGESFFVREENGSSCGAG